MSRSAYGWSRSARRSELRETTSSTARSRRSTASDATWAVYRSRCSETSTCTPTQCVTVPAASASGASETCVHTVVPSRRSARTVREISRCAAIAARSSWASTGSARIDSSTCGLRPRTSEAAKPVSRSNAGFTHTTGISASRGPVTNIATPTPSIARVHSSWTCAGSSVPSPGELPIVTSDGSCAGRLDTDATGALLSRLDIQP